MEHRITINELINRKQIRSDHSFEWLNRMTDDEIQEFDDELDVELTEMGVDHTFPQWNSTVTAKYIDRDIMFRLMLNEDRIKKSDKN